VFYLRFVFHSWAWRCGRQKLAYFHALASVRYSSWMHVTHVTEDLQVFFLPIACIYGSSVTDAMFTPDVAELLANFPSIARTCCEYPAAFSLIFFSFLFLSQNGKHGEET
jgi:hypothetical protein